MRGSLEGPILGIDPGLQCTGYGLIEETATRQWHLLCSGEIKTSTHDSLSKRLRILFDGFVAIITQHKPAEVALEEVFLAKNFRSALKLGQAYGVMLLASEIHHLPVFEYAPTTVKVAITGYGRASKDQICRMVVKLLNAPLMHLGEHEADALSVALCHAHHTQRRRQIDLANGAS